MGDTEDTAKDQALEAELGGNQVQEATDVAEELGYVGQKTDPIPNEAYSQETDPTTSPDVVDRETVAALVAEHGRDSVVAELEAAVEDHRLERDLDDEGTELEDAVEAEDPEGAPGAKDPPPAPEPEPDPAAPPAPTDDTPQE